MARTASSTILIQTDTSTIGETELVRLYSGQGTGTRILTTQQFTVADLNSGICIPEGTISSSENYITVEIPSCNEETEIELEPIVLPSATPTPTPTNTPAAGPSPTPTVTPTQTPAIAIGEVFGENFIYAREGFQDNGQLIWYSSGFTAVQNAQNFIKELCGLSSTPSQNQNYTVTSTTVDMYKPLAPYTYSNTLSFVQFGSSASYFIDNVGGQTIVTLNNVYRTESANLIAGSRYVFN